MRISPIILLMTYLIYPCSDQIHLSKYSVCSKLELVMTLTHCLQCLTRDLGDYLVSLYSFFNHLLSKRDLIKVIVYSKRLSINT